MRYRLLWLALVCVLILPVIPAPALAAAASDATLHAPQGLELGQVVDDAGQIRFTDEVAAKMVAAGASWTHVNFRLGAFRNWTETETFGFSAINAYDQVVATAERHGLAVVALLSNEAWHGGTAQWQAGSAEVDNGTGENPYLAAFAEQAALPLMQHFAGRVDRWEIWNEPNAEITYLYPSNFAWLLARVDTGIRAAGLASIQIISGGVSSVQDANDIVTPASVGADYLRATYAQGKAVGGWEAIRATSGSYPIDIIGQHIYVDGYRRTTRATVEEALRLVHQAHLDGEGSGGASKPTLVTEMGWASGNVSEAVQADNLQVAYAAIMNTPFVQSASWFFMRDEPVANLSFGLLRADSSEKPAWHGYRVITTPEAPPLPVAGLTVTGFPGGPLLTWRENMAPDLAGYIIERGPSRDGPFAPIIPSSIGTRSFQDVDAPTDVVLFYRVVAVDLLGIPSAPSTPVGGMRVSTSTLEPFERTWERTDRPVRESQVQRTWMWGNGSITGVMTEPYADTDTGFRQVQYFDKSRMEIADTGDGDVLWSVTNGLLVVEMMTGRVQIGDDAFIWREPAAVNVAGDPESGPTYAAMGRLRNEPAATRGTILTQRLNADGTVVTEPSLAALGVKAEQYVPETRHTIAAPFWSFMNATGLVHEDGVDRIGQLFENPYYATGYPITEAYWTTVELAGTPVVLLVQCFERRCLTYTPDNAEGWQVEAGNVGQHYYRWRYGETP